MLDSTSVLKEIEKLRKIHTEGSAFLERLRGKSATEINLLLTGHVTEKKSTASASTNAIQGWLLKHTTNYSYMQERMAIISGKLAIKGFSLDENLVLDNVGKSRFLSIILEVLVNGVPLEKSSASSVEKNRAKQALINTYRAIKLKETPDYYKELLSNVNKVKSDSFSLRFVIQFLLGISVKSSIKIISGEACLSTREQITLELYINAEKEARDALESSIYNVFYSIEQVKYCRNVQIMKLYKIASGKAITAQGKRVASFFDHKDSVAFPSLDEVSSFVTLLWPVTAMKSKILRSEYKAIAGMNAKLGMFDFCRAKVLIEKEGFTLSEAHKKLNPEVDPGLFKRNMKIWSEKKAFTTYWSN